MAIDTDLTLTALRSLLHELIEGPSEHAAWILDHGGDGLLAVLASLSSSEASRKPSPTRSSIAAHTGHVVYCLQLLNRWADGEPNPFATADWGAAWKVERVDEGEWSEMIQTLRTAAEKWMSALEQPRDWDEMALTGTLASAAHIAYHLGAIKQVVNEFRSEAS